jgi:class 3 adenylate cyclase
MDRSRDISEVLGSHLGASERPARVGGFLRLLTPFGLGRDDSPGRNEEVMALLRLIGGHSDDLDRLERELTRALSEARRLGVPPNALPGLAQAYSRAVTRIVDAEAETIRALLAETPEDERADALDEMLSAGQPVSSATFDLLHAVLLRDALAEALTAESLEEPASAPCGIALVDLVGSTTYLETATAEESAELVDILFEAGQLATVGRSVRALKYVGDGVFMAGRDAEAVALAALGAVEHIAERSPIPARAGFAYGLTLRRAGDFFGMPMNLAQLLTKAAGAGTLLATEEAADELPPEMVGRRRTARLGRTRRARVCEISRG